MRTLENALVCFFVQFTSQPGSRNQPLKENRFSDHTNCNSQGSVLLFCICFVFPYLSFERLNITRKPEITRESDRKTVSEAFEKHAEHDKQIKNVH